MAVKIAETTVSPQAVLIKFDSFTVGTHAPDFGKVGRYAVDKLPKMGGVKLKDAEFFAPTFVTVLSFDPDAQTLVPGDCVRVTLNDPTDDNAAAVVAFAFVIQPQAGSGGAVAEQIAKLQEELDTVGTAISDAVVGVSETDSLAETIRKSGDKIGANLHNAGDGGESLTGAVSGVKNAIVGLNAALGNVGGGGFSTLPKFPLTTRTAGGDYGSAGGSGGIRNSVDNALREVLGRIPRTQDTRSFVNALNSSFDRSEVDGVTVMNWTPRTYAGQTDLGGGVTGAQASLVTFARRMLDGSLSILDGLEPLVTSADLEELAASRAILRTEWVEFVNELGNEGGPRHFRADDLMFRIRGTPKTDGSVGGHLGDLGLVLGMLDDKKKVSRKHVINPAEEADLTNFIVIRDYVAAVDRSWQNFKDQQAGGGQDLGSGLVLLSRGLSVVRESVVEATRAMDAVNVGESERLTVELTLPTVNELGAPAVDTAGNLVKTNIFLEDLFRWIAHFAADEATTLIYEGGTNGIATIKGTLNKLIGLVSELLKLLTTAKDDKLPDGLSEPPVVVAVQELKTSLEQTLRQAAKIIP